MNDLTACRNLVLVVVIKSPGKIKMGLYLKHCLLLLSLNRGTATVLIFLLCYSYCTHLDACVYKYLYKKQRGTNPAKGNNSQTNGGTPSLSEGATYMYRSEMCTLLGTYLYLKVKVKVQSVN